MRHKYGSGAHEEDIEESTYHKKFGWHGIKKKPKHQILMLLRTVR